MTRRSKHSKTSALRRALLPALGAIPVAVVVTCAGTAGNAAAQPSVPAPAPVEQLWTGAAQHSITPRTIIPSVVRSLGLVHYGVAAPLLPPSGDHAIRENHRATRHPEPTRATDWRKPNSPGSVRIGGLRPVPVDSNYSDRVTQQTVNGGTAGAVIGTALGGIPAAVLGAIPGAIVGLGIGASIGGIAGGIALAVPTMGLAIPVGVIGGALAGAAVGVVVGGVAGAVMTGVPVGIFGGVVGYALGAATGLGNGQQG
ncbi:hypothetical protein [Nocardia miyunensis]|uniref:hypothetical protein n=1 Tax=Nocardia miyunensis TaxID=282684 RepID=UPI00082D49CB|nr:hypothetical protein [Nocardia miyunensis]